ncbi:MAG: HlyD family secretion protein [Salinibacter sp.]|uniref:HlyD family secretion protein n=1 Tax=Salinibacter sp. TaxID=2065818 RepID=UPI0035D5071D
MSSSLPSPDDSDSTSSRPLGWGQSPAVPQATRAQPLRTNALQAAQTPSVLRGVLFGSIGVLVVLGIALALVPWRQTVSGTGQVTALAPDARPRAVEAQISARVKNWRVTEGDVVAPGDTIAVLEDMSSQYLDNQFSDRIAESRASELRSLRLEVKQARQSLSQARQKRRAARAKVRNASTGLTTARKRYSRVKALQQDGVKSVRSLETAQLKLQKARTDSVAAAASLDAAQQAVASARLNVQQKESTLEAKQARLNLKLENAQERQAASIVQAPIAGTIARINQVGPGQTVKSGDKLALIVPESDDRAAELFVSSIGASLVQPGERVQLQFSGFPALQFSGFPNASVGTFSGTVRFVNPVDDGSGRFRLLVVPDTSGNRPPWPGENYLRQGASVQGNVLLSNVPLGYEIWRRMNGLPPQVSVQQGKNISSK